MIERSDMLRFFVKPAVLRLSILCVAFDGFAAAQWQEPTCRAVMSFTRGQTADLFGWVVRVTDDANGDGVRDIAVAAPFWGANAGRVSLHSGRDGTDLWAFNNVPTGSVFGESLEIGRDFDGDGLRDVLCGAPFGGLGTALVLSTRTGAEIRRISGQARGDAFGYAMEGSGDWDGDGVDDLVIGATGVDTAAGTNVGRVYVHSGVDFSLLTTIDAPTGEEAFGTALAFVGDRDGDGRDELAIGGRDPQRSVDGVLRVYSFDGSNVSALFTVTDVDLGSPICGDHVHAGFDVDGDGTDDLFVGENRQNRARVLSGRDGSVIHTLRIAGENPGWGRIVADINHDGVPDLVVAARASDTGASRAGRLFVLSGRDLRRLRTMTYTVPNGAFGTSTAQFDDLDNDGTLDLVVGAPGFFNGGIGRVFVMAGDPCLAGWSSYGAGLAGTAGVPPLTTDLDPTLGAAATLQIGNSTGASTPGLLAVGDRATALPTPWGGSLLVALIAVFPVTVAPGGIQVPLTVPTDASLCNAEVFFQSMMADPGAVGGVAETAGLRWTLGR